MKAHCMLWEPHLAQTEGWQIGCAQCRSTGTISMWHLLGYVAQTGPERIWSTNESNVSSWHCKKTKKKKNPKTYLVGRFSTLTSQLLRTDRGHTIKVALAPEPPLAPDGPLPVPTTHRKQIDSCKTLITIMKKWSLMLHPPELFFAHFFAGTACEEVHSRAAAKSTSSSRTTPVYERTRTKSVVIENTSNKSALILPEK